MAQDLALRGEAKNALVYTRMALDLAESVRKDDELRLKARAQEATENRLRLDREKFEANEKRLASASEALGDESATDEEKVARVKEIFGIR